jgi:hypothetical protein
MFMYVASRDYHLRNCVIVLSFFRAYLVLSTFCFSILGYQQMFKALGVTFDVRLHYTKVPVLTPLK